MESLSKNYNEARYEVTELVKSALGILAGSVESLNNAELNRAPNLEDFIKAHNHRLGYKSSVAGRSDYHGIAYVEHYCDLLRQMGRVFQSTVATIESKGVSDSDNTHAISQTLQELASDCFSIKEFFGIYAREIAAERLTQEYDKDQNVIAEVVEEFQQVCKLGQWSPEYVMIKDHETGEIHSVEQPSSLELSRLAKMAPEIRKLFWG